MAIDLPSGILRQTDIRENVSGTVESTTAYNLTFAKFQGLLDVTTNKRAIFLSGDGLDLYLGENTSNKVKQYVLSTAFDITTGTTVRELDVSGKVSDFSGLFFKPTGLKMYTTDEGADSIDEYNLSTAWDISSAIYLQELDVSGQDISPRGLFFSEDGKNMFHTGTVGAKVYQYYLSTAWDVSTALFIDSLDFTAPMAVHFSRKGDFMFLSNADKIERYNLTAAFRLSTATTSQTFVITPAMTFNTGIHFNPNGNKMYVLDADDIHQYSLKRSWR